MLAPLTSLVSLEDLDMCAARLDEQLRGPPPSAIEALDQLLEAAEGGDPDARQVLVALALWRARVDDEALLSALRQASAGVARVSPLFDRREAPLALSPHARVEPGVSARATFPWFRAPQHSPWGHRRIASDVRPRLLLGFEPAFFERLLNEPGLDLNTVVALAAARPSPAACLSSLCACARWVQRVEIRRALAANPYTPPALVAALRHTVPRVPWAASPHDALSASR